MTFHEFVEEHLHSSTHLSRRHVHPKLLYMFELAGMDAVFTRASGAHLWTEDGRKFLDLLSGGECTSSGAITHRSAPRCATSSIWTCPICPSPTHRCWAACWPSD